MVHQYHLALEFFLLGIVAALLFAVFMQRREIARKDELIRDFIQTFSQARNALEGIQRQLNLFPEMETSIKVEIRERFMAFEDKIRLVVENELGKIDKS